MSKFYDALEKAKRERGVTDIGPSAVAARSTPSSAPREAPSALLDPEPITVSDVKRPEISTVSVTPAKKNLMSSERGAAALKAVLRPLQNVLNKAKGDYLDRSYEPTA